MSDTDFQIVGLGLMPSSARGLTCDYKKIENGKIHYDVWGVAHSTARPALDLFEVTISCKDVWPPAFAQLTRGQALQIIGLEFIQPAGPQVRPAYNNAVTYYDDANNVLPNSANAYFMGYQPVLNVVLDDFDVSVDEWGALVSWRLKFRETK